MRLEVALPTHMRSIFNLVCMGTDMMMLINGSIDDEDTCVHLNYTDKREHFTGSRVQVSFGHSLDSSPSP